MVRPIDEPSAAPPDGHVSDESWGPETAGGKRRNPVRLTLLVLVALLLGFVAVPATAGLVSLKRLEVTALAGGAPGGPRHTLVVGSDSRDDLTPEQLADLGTGTVDGLRTDTIFILSTQGGRSAILALPRDLWVTRCDGKEGRINSAYGIGGPDCLIETVQQTTGIGIDHYLEVDFPGFIDLVGAVGGVEVCLDKPIKDAFAAIDLPAGCQTLQGRDALGYVRVRKIDNDLKRIERQQGFVAALAHKVLTPAILLNPFRSTAVARAGGRAVAVDGGVGPLDLFALMRGGRGLASGASIATTIPVTDATIGGASVLRAADGAEALYQSFIDGSIFAQIGVTPTEQG